MSTGNLDFARKRKIVAHKHARPSRDRSWKRFVVAITNANDNRMIRCVVF